MCVCVRVCMCMCVCGGCVLFSRRGQAGVVACGEVWEADREWLEWMWSGESKGGVLAWLAGVGAVAAAAAAAAAAALVPCSHSLCFSRQGAFC